MNSVDPRDQIIGHLPAIRAYALSLSQDRALADDLVQDAVIKAWTNFERFRPGSNLKAWLFTILRNLFYSHHRRQSHVVEDVDGRISARLAIKPAHDGRLQMNDLLDALKTLSLEQREALILIGALGFTYEEAAETCQVPLGTIKSRANRARSQIAALLELDETAGIDITDAPTRAVLSRTERPL